MLNKVKAVLVFGSGLMVSGMAVASEVSLNDVTDYYVYEATATTSYEVQNEVYSDILNTTHKVQLEDIGVETRVLITDNHSNVNEVITEAAE